MKLNLRTNELAYSRGIIVLGLWSLTLLKTYKNCVYSQIIIKPVTEMKQKDTTLKIIRPTYYRPEVIFIMNITKNSNHKIEGMILSFAALM